MHNRTEFNEQLFHQKLNSIRETLSNYLFLLVFEITTSFVPRCGALRPSKKMESVRDPELGQESIVKNAAKTQRQVWQNPASLHEPLLTSPNPSTSTGGSDNTFTDNDGTIYTIPSYIEELVPRDTYVQQSGDPTHVLQFKAEVGRLLSRLSMHLEQKSADDEFRCRISRRVEVFSAYHWVFMCFMCAAVFGGYVDRTPSSVAFWLVMVELAAFLTFLARKMRQMYKYENRSQPENLNLKLNFQNMPAVRERMGGEQEFKDFTEPLQNFLDRICTSALAVEP